MRNAFFRQSANRPATSRPAGPMALDQCSETLAMTSTFATVGNRPEREIVEIKRPQDEIVRSAGAKHL